MTNGCFDLLHGGHIWLFQQAKSLGDILIVAVNTDESISQLKGKGRPIFPLEERLEILEAIEFIDYLLPFSELTPYRIISALLPDVLVKGGDWPLDQIVGRQAVEGAGGQVVTIPYRQGKSTSEIIKAIISKNRKNNYPQG
ncbi:MAG: D-glycero-beta-D-manno-heptose 1-phosphate adenylyltransferase [Candidatus Aminicenantes bacterium 4484_214]|nr:MAG: D-glycero-beta-D-manno-heptose 1-phosphate adenylyltransferase [Candidatus Aminicenantes bacterium 4484_214]RLE07326.1 MAG: D-glycero-beta-D-manno-heptose 1-phosphate adenylyltransferase [Candidatus Aminicenantes bacterium]